MLSGSSLGALRELVAVAGITYDYHDEKMTSQNKLLYYESGHD
jgi:hypothetical protein